MFSEKNNFSPFSYGQKQGKRIAHYYRLVERKTAMPTSGKFAEGEINSLEKSFIRTPQERYISRMEVVNGVYRRGNKAFTDTNNETMIRI